MDSLFLLLPLSVLLVLALIGLFAWALESGQFDDLDREGWRVLDDKGPDEASLGRPNKGKVLDKFDLDQDGVNPSQKN